jgi:curved DNA-binding protein CbpA
MKYFNSITNLEQAKIQYRKLAKQLHPDKGGTAYEFQNMQNEFKALLLKLQQNNNIVNSPQQVSTKDELICELGKLAKVLIKNQVPQNYLRLKTRTTESHFKRNLFEDIAILLDSFNQNQ